MILKQYGASYHSVQPNFNPTAITEIGFMRDRAFTIAASDFSGRYELVKSGELGAEAEATVQRRAEKALLTKLEGALGDWVSGLERGQVLVVLNDRDDWPKTRERREAVVVDGENRFHFHWWVAPSLKVAIYAVR